MVRKHYYNFHHLNKVKIRSRGFDEHSTVILIKFSKQTANSFAKITNGYRFLEVIRGEFKAL